MPTAIQKGLGARAAQGRAGVMGASLLGDGYPRSPWSPSRDPVSSWPGGPLGQHRAPTPEALVPARRADPQWRQVTDTRALSGRNTTLSEPVFQAQLSATPWPLRPALVQPSAGTTSEDASAQSPLANGLYVTGNPIPSQLAISGKCL